MSANILVVRLGDLEIPLDVFAEIAHWLVETSEQPAQDLHGLYSTTALLRRCGLDEQRQRIWQEAHDKEFGILPKAIARLPLQDHFLWRDMVVLRLAMTSSEVARAGRFVVEHYRISKAVR